MKFLIAQKEDPKMQKVMEIKRFVKADTVKYETIISSVEAPGRLSSMARTDIIAEASGKIILASIPLKKGSRFKKGDLLFTIYPDEAKLSLYSRKSMFKSTLANLLPDMTFDYPEHEELLRDYFNNLDIMKDFPPLPEITDSKLEIFLASRNLISEYYSIKKDELQLKRHNIYAPYDGTYTDVYLEESAYTNTGGKVATAIRTDILVIEIPLERQDAYWVKIGDKVRVISDLSKKESTGKVIRKSAFIDENTQSQSLFVNVSNTNGNNFLQGEFVHVVFPGHPIDKVMEIPRNAVFNNNEVFVIVDGRLEKRFINKVKVNETTLLFNGVKEGEILVTQTLINVLEGTPVNVLGSSPDPQKEKSGEQSGQGNKKKEKS